MVAFQKPCVCAFQVLVAALWMLVATLILPAASYAQTKQPNIVLVLMDNLGYGEVGVYGGGILRGAPTPRIDAL